MAYGRFLAGLLATFALGTGLYAADKDDGHDHKHGNKGKKLSLPPCPVMDEDPIDLSVSTATDDGPVYFCCKDCIKKLKANPGKYAKKVDAQRKALADLPRVQTTCPVSGKPTDTEVFTEYGGQKVYLCCKDCVSKFKKNPKKYQSALNNGYTYQTNCPVKGEEIDPDYFLELADGRKVFFCCKGCDKKLAKDPKKYLPNLQSQGILVSEKQLAGAKGGHADHDHDHKH